MIYSPSKPFPCHPKSFTHPPNLSSSSPFFHPTCSVQALFSSNNFIQALFYPGVLFNQLVLTQSLFSSKLSPSSPSSHPIRILQPSHPTRSSSCNQTRLHPINPFHQVPLLIQPLFIQSLFPSNPFYQVHLLIQPISSMPLFSFVCNKAPFIQTVHIHPTFFSSSSSSHPNLFLNQRSSELYWRYFKIIHFDPVKNTLFLGQRNIKLMSCQKTNIYNVCLVLGS